MISKKKLGRVVEEHDRSRPELSGPVELTYLSELPIVLLDVVEGRHVAVRPCLMPSES